MPYNNTLSVSQKKLLDLYGHRPELTEREMAKLVGFKYYNYVSTVKANILEEKGYLAGPYHYIDLRRISTPPVKRLLIFIMFQKSESYDFMIRLLMRIESWSFFYPLQESTFNEMIVGIYSTDHEKITSIFDALVDHGVIHYYSIYELENNLCTVNPRFFSERGDETEYDSPMLSLDNAYLEQDFSSEEGKFKLSEIDTRLLMYLQSGFFKGELSKIMKHDAKLEDDGGNRPFVWGYNSWRYSYEKMVKNDIIRKFYLVYPLPKHLCSYFFLILKGRGLEETKRLAANIGAGIRTLISGSLVRSLNNEDAGDVYWCAHIRSHPMFMHRISSLLDIPDVSNKYVYHCKSVSNHNNDRYPVPYMNHYTEQSVSLESRYYDKSTSKLSYDYDGYKKKILDIVESMAKP
ncbi:MAG: hypothetical protein JW825_02120 [Candidatus Methanofastidiosa archaeon]|nr:hypothetical protein [Candidatus Methanofastidiosa archaeon]